jgi:hypothetical protein
MIARRYQKADKDHSELNLLLAEIAPSSRYVRKKFDARHQAHLPETRQPE